MENEHQDSDSSTSVAEEEEEEKKSETSSPRGHLDIPCPPKKAWTANPITPLPRSSTSKTEARISHLPPTPPPIKRRFSPESPSPTRKVKFRSQVALFLPGPSQSQEEDELSEPREWQLSKGDVDEEEEELDELYDSDMELLDGP